MRRPIKEALETVTRTLREIGIDVMRFEVQLQVAVAVGLSVLAAMFTRRWLARQPPDLVRTQLARALAWPGVSIGLLLVAKAGFALADIRPAAISTMIELLFAFGLLRVLELVMRRSFRHSAWLRGAERTITIVLWTAVVLHLLGLLPGVIAWLDSVPIAFGSHKLTPWAVINTSVTVAAALMIAIWLGGLFEDHLASRRRLDSNARLVFGRVVRAVLLILGVFIAMSRVGLDLTALSVFSGALGVGIGFGMQKIAANYISGFIILLDRSIQIGSMISVGPDRGEVRQITTRYTVLRAPSGVDVIVPNETLIGSVVLNETFADQSLRIVLPIQISYGSDVERALEVLVECAAAGGPRVLEQPKPDSHLMAFGASGIDLQLGLWIHDPTLGSLDLRSAINREIWRRFKQAGIQIPFPQHEVRLLGASEGERSAADVASQPVARGNGA
jgi:small-conductance mechanosensitive channel